MYSAVLFILTTLCLFIRTGCNEYKYNIDIKLILFEICLIHTKCVIGYSFTLRILMDFCGFLNTNQRSAMNHFFAIHKHSHENLNISESIILKLSALVV